jgi:hypothetical protein
MPKGRHLPVANDDLGLVPERGQQRINILPNGGYRRDIIPKVEVG